MISSLGMLFSKLEMRLFSIKKNKNRSAFRYVDIIRKDREIKKMDKK